MQQQQHVVVDSSSGAASNSQSNKKDYYGAIPELERSPRRIGTNSSGTPYHHQEGSATLGVPPSGPQPQSRIGGTPQPPPDLPPKVPERSDRSSPPPLPPKKPQHQQPSWPRYAHHSIHLNCQPAVMHKLVKDSFFSGSESRIQIQPEIRILDPDPDPGSL